MAKYQKLFLNLSIIIALFVTEEILLFGTFKDRLTSFIRLFFQFFSTIILLFFSWSSNKKFNLYNFGFLLLLNSLICFSFILNKDTDNMEYYFYQIFIFANTYLLISFVPIKQILKINYKSMLFISVFSLFFYLINIFFPIFTSRLPIIKNRSNVPFKFAVFTNIPINFPIAFRNWGPFREPGVFQIYLIIALIYGLFLEKKINHKNNLILVFAIISTLSTAGVITLFFVLLTYFLKNLTMKNVINVLAILLFCFLPLFFISLEDSLIFGKLYRGAESNTTRTRVASIVSNLKIFLDYPSFFGIGIGNSRYLFPIYTKQIFKYISYSNTNVAMFFLVRYGFIFFVLFILRIVYFMNYYFKYNQICKLMLLFCYFLLLSNEAVNYSILLLLPLFWSSNVEKKNVLEFYPYELSNQDNMIMT